MAEANNALREVTTTDVQQSSPSLPVTSSSPRMENPQSEMTEETIQIPKKDQYPSSNKPETPNEDSRPSSVATMEEDSDGESARPAAAANEKQLEESGDQTEGHGEGSSYPSHAESSSHAPTPTPIDLPSIRIENRPRSDSRSTTATGMTQRSAPLTSAVFVLTALDTIGSSKEAKKNKELEDAVQKAIANIKQSSDHNPIDPEIVFHPLQLATKTFSISLQVAALDCIGTLISYSYFAFPSSVSGTQENDELSQLPLIERAIETICDCFENESTPVEIQQQIIKSLLAAVLNDKIVVHGAGLLKAVRQIYNIFIYSKSSQNQHIAQGSLTQMVGTVYDRLRTRLDLKEGRLRDHGDSTPPDDSTDHLEEQSVNNEIPVPEVPVEKLTLESFERTKDDTVVTDNAPTMVTRARGGHRPSKSSVIDIGDSSSDDELDEIYAKDAFLVFRALCKLSHKILPHDQQQDLKSQNMRSKLLSLHLIQHLLSTQISVFTSPLTTIRSNSNSTEGMTLLQAIKPHLCLSLSRNGASAVSRVYEVCCEIFWLMLKNMRVMFKKELEVFFKEIYLAILDKRQSPSFQKLGFMDIVGRLCSDPRALVEIYLNYDCDRTALENLFQGTIEHLSRLSSIPMSVTPFQEQQYYEYHAKSPAPREPHQKDTLPPSLTSAKMGGHSSSPPPTVPHEYAVKQRALELLVEILRSLEAWSNQKPEGSNQSTQDTDSPVSADHSRESLDVRAMPSPRLDSAGSGSGGDNGSAVIPIAEDDPGQMERVKQRKIALSNAIRQFNFKPKRGIKMLLSDGFIRSKAPADIAHFFLRNDRLDKAALGEFLGEGDTENIAIMHAFVDQLDFAKRPFVHALRQFLQSFRLPGESQKIDRFMLKFAERYLSGNPNAFKSADTAYILSYSVIMLNTDLHSIKFKGRRMTKDDFIKNNRGIDDGCDLERDYLGAIYDEIANNEIVLETERANAANLGIPTQPPPGLAVRAGQVLATVGRDIQGEKYAQASEEIAGKTEQLYRSLIRAQRKSAMKEAFSKFIPATSVQHVGSMFNVTWMSFLSGLSAHVQETNNLYAIRLVMDGLRLSIRISCMFDLDTPRVAFVTALAKFTNLGNLREMVSKNLEALKVLLEVAMTEGNYLKSAWREILTCISQLDRFQLLTDGVDEGSLPDVSIRVASTVAEAARPRRSVTSKQRSNGSVFRSEVAMESRSIDMVRMVDRIFTNTANLSSEAIVDFIRALSIVSWQEIQSSGLSESPRTYSLQKLVEISYYNMTRVRIEWSRIWEVLGQHFNQVGCHNNTVVVFFALDSLRQLSMRFLEIGELPGFRFQKDFLKPFEHIMANSTVALVKDMVLRCLIQMIQARGDNIKSGWKTMFGVFTVAAKEPYESIVNLAFDQAAHIYKHRFGVVITQGAFADLIVCLTEFSKNLKFQKKSLQAIETLKSTAYKMTKTPECPLCRDRGNHESSIEQPAIISGGQSPEEQFWYPLLIAFQDVLMTGDDLEVRSRALSYLFEILVRYGGDFPNEFWEVLWRQVLYPIFVVLQSKSEMSKVPNHEDLSVWLSTTMIQALRNVITLFTHYFDALRHMLDRFLNLLILCICQDNDTIARIGSNCLQQLILQNVIKFSPDDWSKIVCAFVDLFERTTAYELFTAAGPEGQRALDETSASENNGKIHEAEGDRGANGVNNLDSAQDVSTDQQVDGQPAPVVTVSRRRVFNKIITNCVLQLLMIETVNELFMNESVYEQIPSEEVFRLMTLLEKSYQFAKRFNAAKELRMQLWRQGFMKQPPNLLKQESGSASTYVNILFRMYQDEEEDRRRLRTETEQALVPLCVDIISNYIQLDDETQHRNITAWRPVVVDVLEGYTNFPRPAFETHIETFYPLCVELLGREISSDIRIALQGLLRKLGECKFNMVLSMPAPDAASREEED